MQTTEILMTEHQNILKVLEKFENALGRPLDENIEEIEHYLNFINVYSDDFHHAKEEKIYFKWLISKKPALKDGPVACMLKEHDEFRALVANGKNAMLEFAKDPTNKDAGTTAIACFESFIEGLRQHINKEDEILYKMAESIDAESKDGDKLMMQMFKDVQDTYAERIETFHTLIQS